MTAITMYIVAGAVTFCGVPVADAPPWVAMPVSTFGTEWQCGDTIVIVADGELHTLVALDSGPFGAHCVRQLDGSCPRIAADVPAPYAWFDGLSTVGTVHNATAHRESQNQPPGG